MLVGSVGSLGALAAPILVGSISEVGSIAFVAVALAAGVGVLLWQRWDWLALGAFVVSAHAAGRLDRRSGFITFEGEADPSQPVPLVLAVLVGFWLLYAAAAFGYELRSRSEERLPVASWLLLLCGSSSRRRRSATSCSTSDWRLDAADWMPGSSGSPLPIFYSAVPRSASASTAKSARC